jgi:DHA1 family inner membrane transport protein
MVNRAVLTGLAVTLLTLTGFVAVFTYVAALLSTVAGFSPGWVSVALVGYGLGTVAGNVLAGRVPPAAVPRVLPVPLAVLAGAGLVGVLVFCPRIPADASADAGRLGDVVRLVADRAVLTGLAVTLLTLTGFVAVFTYVAPLLSTVADVSPGWVSVGLVGYGLGTVAGNVLAGRVPPAAVPRVLPVPLAVLAVVLSAQPVLLRIPAAALVGLVVLGAATFVVVPLLQTWLMAQVGPSAAGLVAAVNISVAGVAGALGAGLGGAVLAVGLGLIAIGPVAAFPVLGALGTALALRARPAGVLCRD